MPRKPKPRPQTQQDEEELSSSSVEPDIVTEEIQSHRESGALDFIQQAAVNLNTNKPQSKTGRYKENLKARKNAQAEDVSTIVVTLLTLLVSAWSIPQDLKPNDEEINAFSVPAVRMLLRHVPIMAKMSQDALDVVGMIGALSAYYVRTGDEWKKYNETRDKVQRMERQTKIEAQALSENMPPVPLASLYDTQESAPL